MKILLNEFDQIFVNMTNFFTTTNLKLWIWLKLKPTNLDHKDWSVITSGVLLTSMPDIFFIVDEWSEVVPASVSFQARAGGHVQAEGTILKITYFSVRFEKFVVVKIFRSHSNPFLVIFIRSCEFASFKNKILMFSANWCFNEQST